jgi:DNA-binding MarR family transcriptional regulator
MLAGKQSLWGVVPTRFDKQEVGRLRGALARIARSIDRQVPTEGLTRSQVWVLGTVARMGPIGMSELAEIEGVNPTMLSRMVGKMADAGLLARVPDARDGRAVLVQVTAEGTALQDRLRVERSRLFAERLAELPEEFAAQLLGALPALEALGQLMRRESKSDS